MEINSSAAACSPDICGPINPISVSGKRYILNFIDDFSRKCWTYLLSEKSETFQFFKEFKAETERESGQKLVCLWSYRGGEYNSREFEEYFKEFGIKRQLKAAYTPQQNGVAERKNRSVMNMTRCMLMEKFVPRKFWPEAVQYAVDILNRSPSKALNDITPEEKWSNWKPSVEHLRIFGSVAYALVPYQKRIKLDERNIKCVVFGVSKESKAYRLYNPATGKIIISRDVHFDESKGWEWEDKSLEQELVCDDSDHEPAGERNPEIDHIEQPEHEEPEEEETVEEVAHQIPQAVGTGGGRQRQQPVWMKDYVIGNARILIAEEEEDEMLALFVGPDDPECFEDAVKLEVWKKAMEAEITSHGS